jgi:hypothetical protein
LVFGSAFTVTIPFVDAESLPSVRPSFDARVRVPKCACHGKELSSTYYGKLKTPISVKQQLTGEEQEEIRLISHWTLPTRQRRRL